jgi:exodeoxyribonuclease V alpha subunit
MADPGAGRNRCPQKKGRCHHPKLKIGTDTNALNMTAKPHDALQTVGFEGVVEKVTYYNSDNQFAILRFRIAKTDNLVTVLGHLPHPRPGTEMHITGAWETHHRYGQQFRLISTVTLLPATIEGIRQYLSAGFVKGLGPKIIGQLVDHFKEETLNIIENEPDKLRDVRGIGGKTAQVIADAWKNENAMRRLMEYLQENSLNPAFASRIYAVYGDKSLEVLTSDPYRLVLDLPRIGFSIADAITQRAGTPPDDAQRCQACVLHTLREVAEEGNTFTPLNELEDRCRRIFGIDSTPLAAAVEKLVSIEEIVAEDCLFDPPDREVFLQVLHRAEFGVAARLKTLLSLPAESNEINGEHIVEQVFKHLVIELSPEQTKIIETVFLHRVAIITGGPGTGKTTLIRAITAVFDSLGKSVLLGAPTGRAARRLSEVARRNAHTIHKLLGYNPTADGFEHDLDNPLPADVVIIDEASMVDIALMNHLLQAVHVTSRLILVGDVFQLPSIGPGTVLADLIRSEAIPTFELNTIYRQNRDSSIIRNAHRVRRGEQPELPPAEFPEQVSDFYFFEEHRPEMVVDMIIDLCCRKIPWQFGLDPVKDIQILTPMHKGIVGTLNLNRVLQHRLNPQSAEIRSGGQAFKIGDKVMHLKNNYRKDVYNGDSGILSDIDQKNDIVVVDYDGRIVQYTRAELEDISLAYAMTVHKSQGSEYPAIVMPVMSQHFVMLQRNLLYTAITRGKQLVVLIGTRKAVGIALANIRPRQRLSRLADRLAVKD